MTTSHFTAALKRITALLVVAGLTLCLSGCDPQIYGSVGISSGYGGYGGWGSPRMHSSISVGGRIR